MERIGVVLVQPVVTVKEKELLAPEHAREGLAHYLGLLFTDGWRRDRFVKFIGFTKPLSKDFIKLLSKSFALLFQRSFGEPHANRFGLARADLDLVVRRNVGTLLIGIHRDLLGLDYTVVDAVLDVGTLVLLPEKPFVVGFVFGEEQRHVAFAGKDVFTQQRMHGCSRARARGGMDLLESRFFGSPVWFGNPLRPVVAEPERWQEMQLCRIRSPIDCCDPHQTIFRPIF